MFLDYIYNWSFLAKMEIITAAVSQQVVMRNKGEYMGGGSFELFNVT